MCTSVKEGGRPRVKDYTIIVNTNTVYHKNTKTNLEKIIGV